MIEPQGDQSSSRFGIRVRTVRIVTFILRRSERAAAGTDACSEGPKVSWCGLGSEAVRGF
jgi:hypothetical protein